MVVNLPLNSFSFFKVFVGTVFLFFTLFSGVIENSAIIITLAIGKAHLLGAWLAMWRSNKLNWRYAIWMTILIICISFWGITSDPSMHLLGLVTYLFFTFHFFFDEFDLQETTRTLSNVIVSISPAFIVLLLLLNDFLALGIHNITFYSIALVFLFIEFIYVREITWFIIHMKFLLVFVLTAIYFGIPANIILNTFLVFHYLFWFIYPVYKLHKYKREDRDGLIIILLLLVATSVYFAPAIKSYGVETLNLAQRIFLVGTIVHVLSTAPFGYLFGLPKPKFRPY